MMQQNASSPPRPPQRYWDDSQWAIQNIQMLTASFPNEWVAVFNKQVVAHHPDLDQVLTTTQSNRLNSPVIKFIERGMYVYNLVDVSNEL
jgi:hypothetical protein